MKKSLMLVLIFSAVALCPVFSLVPDIDTIISRFEANRVFNTAHTVSELTVSDSMGTSRNAFESWSRKNGDTLIAITRGPDKGQKILRLGDSIYLYYPDAEEIIRLQGSALKNSIMGSDFSYEDLSGDNSISANYTASLVGVEDLDGKSCYRVLLLAKNRRQTYQKQELWIDSTMYIPLKTVLYSAGGKAVDGKALREMSVTDIRKTGRYYIPFTSTMKDLLKKNSRTVMTIVSVEVDIPIPDSRFSREELSW